MVTWLPYWPRTPVLTCLLYVFARYQGTARLLVNSFASSLWMLPFSKYCRADNAYWKHFYGGSRHGNHKYHCEDQEFRSNFSGFPTNIINIEIPSTRGKTFETDACLIGTTLLPFSHASYVFYYQDLMPIHQLQK